MTTKVSLSRRWIGPVPEDRNGEPLPRSTWPRRRPSSWIVRWFAPDPDGKIRRLQKTFRERAEAEEFQAATQASFDRSPNSRHAPRPITIAEFAEEFNGSGIGGRGKRLAPSTIAKTVQALQELGELVGPDTELRRITTAETDRFLAALRKRGLAKTSVGSIVATLKAAFNLAVNRRKYITENPFAGTHIDTKVGPVRYVSRVEWSAVMTTINKGPNALWWRVFLTTAYTTALRLGELTHLTWRDIDFAAETVRVSAKKATDQTLAWEPKTKPSLREVPAPAGTMALLAELQQALPDRSTYVFLPASRFKLIRAAMSIGAWRETATVINNVGRDLRRIVERAAESVPSLIDGHGKATASMHDLRRSCITNWAKRLPIKAVMQFAGHSRIETTMLYYASVTPDDYTLARTLAEEVLHSKNLEDVTCPANRDR